MRFKIGDIVRCVYKPITESHNISFYGATGKIIGKDYNDNYIVKFFNLNIIRAFSDDNLKRIPI